MTRRQKADLRISEIRSKLNEYAGKDSLTAEESAKVTELEGQLRAAEVEQRAAIREEAEQAAAAPADPQLSALERRVELRRYVGAVLSDDPFSGAELEFSQALELGGREIPLAAFAPMPAEPERRADATTNAPAEVGQSQLTVLQRVFARSAAMWLGVRFDQVPAGLPVYPVISAGAKPSTLAAGTAHGDITAATIDGFQLSPGREQVMYSYRLEDQAKFGASLESALRMDMSGAMAEHLDKQILTRANTGFLNELTDPANPGAVTTYQKWIEIVGGLVDGRYAHTTADVKVLMGAKAYGFLSSVIAANTSVSAVGWSRRETGGLRVSAHIPDPATNKKVGQAIASLSMNSGAAICAHWPGIQLIVDRVTQKKAGRVDLSLVSLWDFKIVREDPFKIIETQQVA